MSGLCFSTSPLLPVAARDADRLIWGRRLRALSLLWNPSKLASLGTECAACCGVGVGDCGEDLRLLSFLLPIVRRKCEGRERQGAYNQTS